MFGLMMFDVVFVLKWFVDVEFVFVVVFFGVFDEVNCLIV